MDRPDALCDQVAAQQHGCISFEQARVCGLSGDSVRRRVAGRRWRRVLPDVYAVAGAPATREQAMAAALLWGGIQATLCGATAAVLWRMPGFDPATIEIAGATGKRNRPGVRVHRTDVQPTERARIRGFSVTTAQRTLADLSARLGQDAFDAALHYCLHARLATLEEMRAAAERHGRRAGAPRLRKALDLYATDPRPAASVLESRFARHLQRSRLPSPHRQFEVRVPSGRRYIDFAWPDRRVGAEVDGYRWHSSRSAWRGDRQRLAELRREGWTIVHVTAEDLASGGQHIIEELSGMLRPASGNRRNSHV